ncbi:hypothetical protein H0H92_000784, partial [Tricholoma furcatifolium]
MPSPSPSLSPPSTALEILLARRHGNPQVQFTALELRLIWNGLDHDIRALNVLKQARIKLKMDIFSGRGLLAYGNEKAKGAATATPTPTPTRAFGGDLWGGKGRARMGTSTGTRTRARGCVGVGVGAEARMKGEDEDQQSLDDDVGRGCGVMRE